MKIKKEQKLNKENFIKNYLNQNIPLIVTDAMEQWPGYQKWGPDFFLYYFSEIKVQLYDSLFKLVSITTIGNYIRRYFNIEEQKNIPYIRAYTKLKEADFIWSDQLFNKLKNDWDNPYFLPNTNFLLPKCIQPNTVNPNQHNFPAKGLFISGKGAETKLHYDPWMSDAILCQFYGKKIISLYKPEKTELLFNKKNSDTNLNQINVGNTVKPDYIDIINAGEIIFIPNSWCHHVQTISDSISVTWNFVHLSTWQNFFNYLVTKPNESELAIVKWFINNNKN